MGYQRNPSSASLAAADYGVKCDNNTLNSTLLNNAIQDAQLMGYTRVTLPGIDSLYTHGILWIDRTIKLPSNIELWGPPGLVVKAWPTFFGAMFQNSDSVNGNSGVRLSGRWVIDGNSAGGATATGLSFTNLDDSDIQGVLVQNVKEMGIVLNGCARVSFARVRSFANGENGYQIQNSNDCQFSACIVRNNSQNGAASFHGFRLVGSSSHNVFAGCRAYDDQGTKTQGYGWAEDTVGNGFTGDYNVFAASDFNGNVTGNVRVTGANSGSTTTGTFSATTLANPRITGGAVTTDGELGYDTTNHVITVGDGSNAHSLVSADQAQTLTNKTLDGAGVGVIKDTLLQGTINNSAGEITGGKVTAVTIQGVGYKVRTVSGPATDNVANTDYLLLLDASGGDITENLPAATGGGRRIVCIVLGAGTNSVTLAPNGSDVISQGTFSTNQTVAIVDYTAGAWIIETPSQDAVTLTDTQTLTNKTFNDTSNVVSKIGEVVLAADQASITFSSIPQGFRSLRLVGFAQSSGGEVAIRLNGDTGTNYDYLAMKGINGSAISTNDAVAATSMIVGDATDYTGTALLSFAPVEIELPNYANTSYYKSVLYKWFAQSVPGTTSGLEAGIGGGTWQSTAAVTSITLIGQASGWKAGTSFYLYGEP